MSKSKRGTALTKISMRILPITFLELKLKTNIFQFKKLLKSRKKVSMVKSKISQSKVDSILKINASFQDQSGSKWARGGVLV